MATLHQSEELLPHRAIRTVIDEPAPLAQSALDLRYIVAAVRANLVLIAAIMAVAIGFAVVATLLQTPRYTATATLQINDTTSRVFKDEGGEQAADMPGWDTDRNLRTQVDILQSRALAQRVVQKLRLADSPQFFQSQEVPVPERGRPAAAVNALALGLLQQNLSVTPPRDSRIVTISWQSTDPRLSALIASTYASEFIQANLQRKFESSAYARNFIAEQLAETKKRLEASERAVNDYARTNGLIQFRDTSGGDGKGGSGGGGASSVTTSSLLQINQAANEATSRRIGAEARLRALSGKSLMSVPEVINNGTVATLMQQRSAAQAELQQERARHLDGYPTVLAKAAQVAALDRQIGEAAAAVKQSVIADYQAAQSAEERLTAQVNSLKSDTLGEQDKTVQYSLLAREADTNRQLYDGLLQRYKELNASAGISLSNISVIDTADVPSGPSSPNLVKNLVVAFALGSLVAALTVFCKIQFDDSIRVPEDVESKCDLPLLGVVPTSDNDPQTALEDPKSPVSESYNSLRGSLLYSTSEGLPQVLLVTSAQPGEGKTTTSLAIAASFARMGKSVLLIDADLRHPSLHRQVGSGNDKGLSSLLTSKDPIESVIVPSAHANLMLMTSGAIPPSPTELVSGARLEQIVQEASRRFELVIIDSPPVLGLADAPIMAPLVDGVVFVIEAGRSRRGSLKTALRRLRAMRPIILGAVLTKFDPDKAGNGYSEYYGYEYFQYGSAAAKD